MKHGSPLPSVEIRTPYGPTSAWSVTIDGHRLRKIRSISVEAQSVSGLPLVTIKLWADVTFIGEAEVDLMCPQRVAHCGRPHSDEMEVSLPGATSHTLTPENASMDDSEACPEPLRQ